MRNPQGYATITDPTLGSVVEMDTFTCAHCNGVVHVKPKASPDELGGFCRLCMKMTCPRCDDRGSCTPFEKKLEEIERAYHARRYICEAVD